MVTVLRAQGLSIVIFVDDHAKVNLAGPGGAPQLVWAVDMKRNDVRRAMQIVTEHQEALLARWRAIHD